MKCRVMWHLIRVYTVCYYTLLGLVTRRIGICACERQKGRPVCTFAESDQPLYFSCATTLLKMRSNIMQHLIWVCTVYYLLMSSNVFQMGCGVIYINPTNEHYYTSRHIGDDKLLPFMPHVGYIFRIRKPLSTLSQYTLRHDFSLVPSE